MDIEYHPLCVSLRLRVFARTLRKCRAPTAKMCDERTSDLGYEHHEPGRPEMAKTFRCICFCAAVFWPALLLAGDTALDVRLTLSGHVLLGVGVRQEVARNGWLEVGVYTGIARVVNLGLHVGYVRGLGNPDGRQPVLSVGYDQLFARERTGVWRTVPLLRSTVAYWFDVGGRPFGPELWIGFFPKRGRPFPMGLGIVRSW